MKKIFIVLGLTLSFIARGEDSFFSFKSKDKISGKVIIVMKSGVSLNLGLVEVRAVTKENAQKWKQIVLEDCNQVCAKLILRKKQREDDITNAKQNSEAQVKKLIDKRQKLNEAKVLAKELWLVNSNNNECQEKLLKLLGDNNFFSNQNLNTEANNKKHNWRSIYELSNNEITEIDRTVAETDPLIVRRIKEINDEYDLDVRIMYKELERKLSAEYFEAVPQSLCAAIDRTDETGTFNLSVPSGDYYIFANSRRELFANIEEYNWAYYVKVPSQESEKCLLGNMNLLDSYSSGNLWYEIGQNIVEKYQWKIDTNFKYLIKRSQL